MRILVCRESADGRIDDLLCFFRHIAAFYGVGRSEIAAVCRPVCCDGVHAIAFAVGSDGTDGDADAAGIAEFRLQFLMIAGAARFGHIGDEPVVPRRKGMGRTIEDAALALDAQVFFLQGVRRYVGVGNDRYEAHPRAIFGSNQGVVEAQRPQAGVFSGKDVGKGRFRLFDQYGNVAVAVAGEPMGPESPLVELVSQTVRRIVEETVRRIVTFGIDDRRRRLDHGQVNLHAQDDDRPAPWPDGLGPVRFGYFFLLWPAVHTGKSHQIGPQALCLPFDPLFQGASLLPCHALSFHVITSE